MRRMQLWRHWLLWILGGKRLMAKRISVLLSDELHRKVIQYQIKKMNETDSGFSFSQTINELLDEALK